MSTVHDPLKQTAHLIAELNEEADALLAKVRLITAELATAKRACEELWEYDLDASADMARAFAANLSAAKETYNDNEFPDPNDLGNLVEDSRKLATCLSAAADSH